MQAEAFLWPQFLTPGMGTGYQECHTAVDVFSGWVQKQCAPLFPFSLSQGPFLVLPFPHRLFLLFLPFLLVHHHGNQARLLPVGLGLSGR